MINNNFEEQNENMIHHIFTYLDAVDLEKVKCYNYADTNGIENVFLYHCEDFNVKFKKDLKISYQASGISEIECILYEKRFNWEKLNEIKFLLQSGCYKTALISALTLPEICSKIEYKDIEASTNDEMKYQKWFNENVYFSEIGDHGRNKSNFDCLNGNMCYSLRCRLMHGDQNDIEDMVNNNKSSFKEVKKYNKVFFRFHDKLYSEMFTIINNKNEQFAVIFHSIYQLILSILCAADGLYKRTDNKKLFYDGCSITRISNIIKIDRKSMLDNLLLEN